MAPAFGLDARSVGDLGRRRHSVPSMTGALASSRRSIIAGLGDRSRSRSAAAGSPPRAGIPPRTGALIAVVLAIGLPVTWYLASPIFLRTSLVEADGSPRRSRHWRHPVLIDQARPRARPVGRPSDREPRPRAPTAHPEAGPDDLPSPAIVATLGSLPWLGRLPLRAGHRHDRRDGPGPLPPPVRGLLGPQRPRPLRLPLAIRRRIRRWLARAGQAQGHRWRLRL